MENSCRVQVRNQRDQLGAVVVVEAEDGDLDLTHSSKDEECVDSQYIMNIE